MTSDHDNQPETPALLRKAQTALRLARYKLNPLETTWIQSSRKQPLGAPDLDIAKRDAVVEKFRDILEKNGKKVSGPTICDCYFNETIREKTVLLVGLGRNVRGSLQYILNELNYSQEFEGFRAYVRTIPETDEIVKKYIEDNHWTRTETVLNDARYSQLMESVKYCLTEVYFPEGWVKKEGQVYINIWHGTPLKKLGLAKNQKNKHVSGIIQKNFIDADYLLYPNQYTREKMLRSYKVEPLMQGQALMLGYPRTGGMLEAAQGDVDSIRRILAPEGETIYVYMPTFRDYMENDAVVAQSKELLDFLDENLRQDQILYVNLHHKVSDSLDYSHYKHIRKFPPNLDSYKILAASQALITDYSSVFFDYLALRKQIILFIEDYETYRKNRGMYMDLMELPFDKAATKDELLAALNRGKTYDDEEAFRTYCAYDSKDNAKKLCQLILDKEEGLQLEPLNKTGRHRFLIYSEAFEPGIPSQFMAGFVHRFDRSKYEVYLSCDMPSVTADKSGAYPMMSKMAVIGTDPNTHLTAMGKAVKALYLEGKLSFDEAMEYLKYDYAVMGKRMYGRAEFDTVVIYDVDNPEKLIALAQLDAPKVLVLPDRILEKMQAGDTFLKDASRYAARCCGTVFVGSKESRDLAEKLLGSEIAGHTEILNLTRKL